MSGEDHHGHDRQEDQGDDDHGDPTVLVHGGPLSSLPVMDSTDPTVLSTLQEILTVLERIEVSLRQEPDGTVDPGPEPEPEPGDDSQSVLRRTWDDVRQRWVYSPE